MKIIRFKSDGRISYGVQVDNNVRGLKGSPFSRFKRPPVKFAFAETSYKLQDIRLLAPCVPSKIIGIGFNYHSQIKAEGQPIPTVPIIFLKSSSAVIGPNADIILPSLSKEVVYEGELGVVIGRLAINVSEDKAMEYVIGCTCCNDVSDRDAIIEDKQATRGKSRYTFGPIGPCIETSVVPDDLKIETYLNGKICQSARTSDMVFSVSRLISFISSVMAILPGDVITTGTPAGVGSLNIADVVEVKIEKIGVLKNTVVREV